MRTFTPRMATLFTVAGLLFPAPAHAESLDDVVLGSPVAAPSALQCDGPLFLTQYGGGLAEEGGSGRTRDAAVTRFARGPSRPLPFTGFVAERSTRSRSLYAYRAGGRVRAAIVVAPRKDRDRTGEVWGVESYALCDPSEFDPAQDDDRTVGIWSGATGRRLPTSVVHTEPLFSHCWEGASMLMLGRYATGYLRDPGRTFTSKGVRGTYAADVSRPAEAVDLGLYRGDTHLWMAPDTAAVYAVRPGRVERWPRADIDLEYGCA